MKSIEILQWITYWKRRERACTLQVDRYSDMLKEAVEYEADDWRDA